MVQVAKQRLGVTITLLLVLTACTDDSLKKVAISINDVSIEVAGLQSVVIETSKAKLMSDQTAVSVMQVCLKVTEADKQASAVTRAYTKLAPQDRTKLIEILDPIIAVVKDSIASGVVIQIQDAGTKQKVVGALQIIQVGLTAARGLI